MSAGRLRQGAEGLGEDPGQQGDLAGSQGLVLQVGQVEGDVDPAEAWERKGQSVGLIGDRRSLLCVC